MKRKVLKQIVELSSGLVVLLVSSLIIGDMLDISWSYK